jgi:hypothetical protein
MIIIRHSNNSVSVFRYVCGSLDGVIKKASRRDSAKLVGGNWHRLLLSALVSSATKHCSFPTVRLPFSSASTLLVASIGQETAGHRRAKTLNLHNRMQPPVGTAKKPA